MKKTFKKISKALVFMVLLLTLPFAAFCQTETVVPVTDYFGSIGAVSALVIMFTALIATYIPVRKFLKQLISWLIALGVSFVGWKMELGIFVGLTPVMVGVYGLLIGLVANGLADIAFVKTILNTIDKAKNQLP